MNDYQKKTAKMESGPSLRMIGILLLLAFIGGIILAGWAAQRFNLFGARTKELQAQVAPPPPAIATMNSKDAGSSAMPNLAVAETRVDNLENRISQINADAQTASGNAARAEGMLIAFAARRAIDNGAPLGYIADQLQLRFGTIQPRAVLSVIAAAPKPITLTMLQGDLTNLGESLTVNRDGGIWESAKREMSDLFIIRKEGTPSPAPRQRLQRALRLIETGDVAKAAAEVRALPGAANAQDWLKKADLYLQVHDALDSIERAAIMTAPPMPPTISSPQQPTPQIPAEKGDLGDQ